MTRVDELIQADSTNAIAARDLLDAFESTLIPPVGTAAGLFEVFNHRAGEAFSALDQEDDGQLNAIAERSQLSPEELIDRIRSSGAVGREIEQGRACWDAARRRKAKVFVLLVLHRYPRLGVADLLRFRITPALGCGRLQTEACALLHLFVDDPARADPWLHTGESGGRWTCSSRSEPCRSFAEDRSSAVHAADVVALLDGAVQGNEDVGHVSHQIAIQIALHMCNERGHFERSKRAHLCARTRAACVDAASRQAAAVLRSTGTGNPGRERPRTGRGAA